MVIPARKDGGGTEKVRLGTAKTPRISAEATEGQAPVSVQVSSDQ
jgi:hypothetical protein